MSLELTARLTLSSCVSQLTDFYLTTIQPLLLENGYCPITIRLCDLDGEAYDYKIDLLPRKVEDGLGMVESLWIGVFLFDRTEGFWFNEAKFSCHITKNGMTTRNLYQCALHVCGDFIKFNEKGI